MSSIKVAEIFLVEKVTNSIPWHIGKMTKLDHLEKIYCHSFALKYSLRILNLMQLKLCIIAINVEIYMTL